MKDFKTLAIFTYPHEYAVLKLILDQENIEYFFQNEATVSIIPLSAHAFGGIQLRVHALDVEKTKEILRSFNDTSSPLKIL